MPGDPETRTGGYIYDRRIVHGLRALGRQIDVRSLETSFPQPTPAALEHARLVLAGIPGGSIIAMVPVLSAANLPVEGIAILLAVDTIPDMFRTTANVTGAMTLTAIMPLPRSLTSASL